MGERGMAYGIQVYRFVLGEGQELKKRIDGASIAGRGPTLHGGGVALVGDEEPHKRYSGGRMVTNAFIGKSQKPTEDELTAQLGDNKGVWDRLLAELAKEFDLGTAEWNSYSPKAGWSLRLKRGERNIVYLSPGHNCFMASFSLGDKAVRAARESKLPKTLMKTIDESKRYAEGTAVRLDVNGPKDLAAIKRLVAIKLEN
jgi:hypothetical protein